MPAKAATTNVLTPSRPEMIYFVMLDRFENGDPTNDTGGLTGNETTTGFLPSNPGFYHGGDIRGLIKRIPYIKSLGFTAIWVTPVVRQLTVAADGKSSAYHGYWGVGFDQVDPHLGTMDDFKPEGISTRKLWAKFLLSGSLSAKYKSKYIKAAIK